MSGVSNLQSALLSPSSRNSRSRILKPHHACPLVPLLCPHLHQTNKQTEKVSNNNKSKV